MAAVAHSGARVRPWLSRGTFLPPKFATSVKVWSLPPLFLTFTSSPVSSFIRALEVERRARRRMRRVEGWRRHLC
jgi:hypothetical protein